MDPMMFLTAPVEGGFFRLTNEDPGPNYAMVHVTYTAEEKQARFALIFTYVTQRMSAIDAKNVRTLTVSQKEADAIARVATEMLTMWNIPGILKVEFIGSAFVGPRKAFTGYPVLPRGRVSALPTA